MGQVERMKELCITPLFIKEHLENLIVNRTVGLNELNLSDASRKREIVQYRWVGFKLARMLTKSSLTTIGKVYNKDHATVLHGIKEFDNFFTQLDFKDSRDLFEKALKDFKTIQRDLGLDASIKTIEELFLCFQSTLELMNDRCNKKIKELSNQNERMLTNPIFSKIAGLPEDKFADLEVRVNAFLQMNANNDAIELSIKQR